MWGTRELELWYPSQYDRFYAQVTLFLRYFSQNFPDEFHLEFSYQLLNMCPLSLPSFMPLKTPYLGYPGARTWVPHRQ